MSSSNKNTNVTNTTTTFKKVAVTDAEGWTSFKKVAHEKERKPFVQRKGKSTKTSVQSETETKTVTEVKVSVEAKDTETKPVTNVSVEANQTETKKVEVVTTPRPPAKMSGGKGYLSALRGTLDQTPVKTTEQVTPSAPVKASDANSVASDSSDESSHPATPRRLSFSETPTNPVASQATEVKTTVVAKASRTEGARKAHRTDGEYKPRPKRTDGEYKPRPKRTEEESKSHNEYVTALRQAEDNFLRECLPSDKERISKVSFELEKIRNYSSTVHEVSFAKEFAPVTVGGKEVSFSREKFARNKFFISRLKKEYYNLFPTCSWVAIKESTRSDKPDTLYVRVGSRD